MRAVHRYQKMTKALLARKAPYTADPAGTSVGNWLWMTPTFGCGVAVGTAMVGVCVAEAVGLCTALGMRIVTAMRSRQPAASKAAGIHLALS